MRKLRIAHSAVETAHKQAGAIVVALFVRAPRFVEMHLRMLCTGSILARRDVDAFERFDKRKSEIARYLSAVDLDGTLALPMMEAIDEAAFERLMRSHERRVLGLAYRMTGNMADAQDVAQEVFIRLHRNLRSLTEDAIAPWLHRVTINACADFVRRRKVFRFAPLPAVDPESEEPGPDARLSQDADERRLRAALLQLGAKERAALVLRDLEGLSTAEVAVALGSTESTVRVQISKARLKLREMLRGMR